MAKKAAPQKRQQKARKIAPDQPIGNGVQLKDRIIAFERIPGAQLQPHPKNWRTHPPEQRAAVQRAIDEIGFVDALMVRFIQGGYQIIDGHARQESNPDALLPCLVVDLTDAEADRVLASFDPITGLAGTDDDLLRSLLNDLDAAQDELLKMSWPSIDWSEFDDLGDPGPEPEDEPDQEGEGSGWGGGEGQEPPDTVIFHFGDYRGPVSRAVFNSFKAKIEQMREANEGVVLDDVLRAWLEV